MILRVGDEVEFSYQNKHAEGVIVAEVGASYGVRITRHIGSSGLCHNLNGIITTLDGWFVPIHSLRPPFFIRLLRRRVDYSSLDNAVADYCDKELGRG